MKLQISQDPQNVLQFLERDPVYNLFAISDVAYYGLQHENMQTWEIVDDTQTIQAVLFQYFDFCGLSVSNLTAVSLFRPLFDAMTCRCLTGPFQDVQKFCETKPFEVKEFRKTEIAKLDQKDFIKYEIKSEIHVAKCMADFREMNSLLKIFNFNTASAEKSFDEYQGGFLRTYFIRNAEGKMISVGTATAQNSKSAMIVGVGTHPDCQRQGLARELMVKLCGDLLDEGITPCLFYDNPNAKKLYEGMGFKVHGDFAMVFPKQN